MIELSNTTAQVLPAGQSITFDKERMEEHGKEHVDKAIISMRDIWSEASPELKRAMKTELSTLVDNMTI